MFIAGLLTMWVLMSIRLKIYKQNIEYLVDGEIKELTDHIQKINDLSEARADLIKQANKSHNLYKNQYKTLNEILDLKDDEDKAKQLDDLYTAILYVGEKHNYIDKDFENIVWQLRNLIQFENSYWKFKSLEYRENSLYPMIKEKIIIKIKNAKLLDKVNDPKHKPDLWVELSNKEIPVKVKKFDFGKTALRQLQRYMNFYKSTQGIAVAKNLTTELPNNIRFISIKELEEISNEHNNNL